MSSLNVDGITAKTEGIGLITPVTEAISEERVEVRKKYVMLNKGF